MSAAISLEDSARTVSSSTRSWPRFFSSQLVAVYVAQGERQQQVDYCVADADGQRWVDCKVSDYVACLQAVDAAGDVCASQTASECETLATCIAEQQP